MANALFDPGRQGILDGTISVSVGTVRASLMNGYTFNAAHEFVSDITTAGGVQVATMMLISKTETSGVFDAANVTFSAVALGSPVTGILIFQSSAPTGGADLAASAQRVIAYIDTATGLPVTPNGGSITISWDTGSNKIFTL